MAAECLSMVATMLHRRQIEGGKKKFSTLFSELSMIPLLAGVFIRGGVEGGECANKGGWPPSSKANKASLSSPRARNEAMVSSV